jgi:hypothetical protein
VFLCGVPSVSRRSRSMPSAGIFPDRAAVAANLRKNPRPIFSPVDGLPGELRSGTPSPNATRALLPTIACWRLRALSVQRAGQRARCCCFGAARTDRPRLRRRRHQNAGCIAVSHLDRRLERRTGSCKTVAHGFAEARSALEPDEGQAGKVGRGDDWLFGERMLMRPHADHLAGVNHFMGDARVMRQAEREAELGDVAEHAFDDAFTAPHIEEHPCLRTSAQKARQSGWNDAVGERRSRHDRQMPGAVLAQIAHAILACSAKIASLSLCSAIASAVGNSRLLTRSACASMVFSALLTAGCESANSSAAATVVRWQMTARRISSWRRFI